MSDYTNFPPFEPFPKLHRLKRTCIITEKIDGTNAQICVNELGEVFAGSRNRWISPEDDNYGFAAWVRDNTDTLRLLGPGRHFGEWWGAGIQRRYGLTERRFSLFNTGRWSNPASRPASCHVVPVLYVGEFNTSAVDLALEYLRANGSRAAPGFMNPEGVVVFHTASNTMQKVTLGGDGHKSCANVSAAGTNPG